MPDRYSEDATMEKAYLEQTRHREIDLVVVSDAEAILGIGGELNLTFAIGIAPLIHDVSDQGVGVSR